MGFRVRRGSGLKSLELERSMDHLWDYMGFPIIRGALFGGPHNKDYSILGPILGSPYFWETTIFFFQEDVSSCYTIAVVVVQV